MLKRHDGSIFLAHTKLSTRYVLKNNGNILSTNKRSTILSNAYSTVTLKSSVKQNNQLEIDNETAAETDFVDESCVEKNLTL